MQQVALLALRMRLSSCRAFCLLPFVGSSSALISPPSLRLLQFLSGNAVEISAGMLNGQLVQVQGSLAIQPPFSSNAAMQGSDSRASSRFGAVCSCVCADYKFLCYLCHSVLVLIASFVTVACVCCSRFFSRLRSDRAADPECFWADLRDFAALLLDINTDYLTSRSEKLVSRSVNA